MYIRYKLATTINSYTIVPTTILQFTKFLLTSSKIPIATCLLILEFTYNPTDKTAWSSMLIAGIHRSLEILFY